MRAERQNERTAPRNRTPTIVQSTPGALTKILT